MMADSDFAATMARVPDEELVRIAHGDAEDGFVAAAVEAARAELAVRGVSAVASDELLFEAAEVRAKDDARAERPLGTGGWIAFALFAPALLLTIPAIVVLRAMGYREMASDARGGVVAGILAYLALAMVLLIVALFAGG
jgi:hypothetical protein